MDSGDQHGGAEAGVGDPVAVAVRLSFDEPVRSESSEVVGGLTGGDVDRREAAELGGELAQVVVGEPGDLGPEGQQCRQQGVLAWSSQRQAACKRQQRCSCPKYFRSNSGRGQTSGDPLGLAEYSSYRFGS